MVIELTCVERAQRDDLRGMLPTFVEAELEGSVVKGVDRRVLQQVGAAQPEHR